jgi:uncharacterized membrane protein
MTEVIHFIGRLHPLLVHLPIGILVMAFLLDIFGRRKKYQVLGAGVPFVLLVGAISSVITLISGWLISRSGQYDETLLDYHFWSAVALTVGVVILYFISQGNKQKRAKKFYVPFFILVMILLTITGHFGGSLTHGSNYLFESPAEGVLIEGAVEDIKVYDQVVSQIFKKKCNSCHNPGKLKGELLLTTKEGILKGGETGAFLLSHGTGKSLAIERIDLPKTEKKHMPPKGKSQLTFDEEKLLKWWINQGGDFDQTAAELNAPQDILAILEKYKTVKSNLPVSNLKPVDGKRLSTLRSMGMVLNPQDEAGILYEAVLALDTSVTRKKFKALKKIGNHIVKLNLLSTNVDDQLLREVRGFKYLQKLDLQHTQVTAAGLKSLTGLKHLKSLNLYATRVDDEVVPIIEELPALEKVYLWQSKISDEALAALQEKRPGLEIFHTIDESLLSDAQLKPPVFATTQDLFKDTLTVAMEKSFRGVRIYYTLDGSVPDTNSAIYEAPFLIDRTTQVKTMAYKEGWIPSEVAQKVFAEARFEAAEVTLSQPPNDSYKADGARTLTDFTRGGERFSEGGWLGYQGEHLTVILDLGQKETLSSVTVGAMEDVGSYIFYPKGIQVFVAGEDKSFTKVAEKDIPVTQEAHPSEIRNFFLNFEETDVRYVKVHIRSNLVNPPQHPAAGAKCWIFIDEIVLN